ncbi:unnamed protein product [Peniophora sp. CBMAI 1063]|nr:unnamed protein product [Peniophora sp. CBMAI 1063]
MPKDTRTPSSRQSQLTSFLDPLVVVYLKRRVVIRRDADYQSTLSTIKRSLRALAHVPASDIIIKSNTIPHQEGEYVDISEDAWPDLVARSYLRTVTVELEEPIGHPVVRPPPFPLPAPIPRSLPGTTNNTHKPSLRLEFTDYAQTIHVNMKYNMRIASALPLVAERLGKCRDSIRMTYEGSRIHDDETASMLNMEDGDVVYVSIEQVGGKPVIYLSPPSSGPAIDATVELELSAPWSLSALYPVRPGSIRTDSSYGQKTSWTVRADPYGVLYDKATETEVSYLYWEAITNPPRPLTPPASPRSSPALVEFDPSRAKLSSMDSVLLPVDKVPTYLDKALAALALHTEARTSFITYWLPSILKHERVALRFVPQAEYEQAARLTVIPSPDVVTRVFMVFRGVSEREMTEWEPAVERAGEDVAFWKDVVGIDASAAQDASLFRVLEWGGMEVLF